MLGGIRHLGMLEDPTGNLLFTGGQFGIRASVLGDLKVLNSNPILIILRQLLYFPLVHLVDVHVCGKGNMQRDIFGNLSVMNHVVTWRLTMHD